MPAGGGLGMRTVWINLRAMNYSDQAFRDTIQNVNKLSEAEKSQYQQLIKNKDASMKQIQVGMLYAAMTMMIAQRVSQLVSTTQVGAQFMAGFNQSFTELKTSIADTLFTALKPLLDMLKSFMDLVKNNGPLKAIIAALIILSVAFLGVYSAVKVVDGMMRLHAATIELNDFLVKHHMVTQTEHGMIINGLSISYKMLAASIAGAFLGFAVAYEILQHVNPIISATIGIILALTAAIIFLKGVGGDYSFLLGLTAAGAAAGSLYAAYNGMSAGTTPSYAVGTAYVPKTGPAILHEGERVLTKEENTKGGRSGSNQTVNIDMSGMTLQTKMDKEELVPFIRKELRNIVTAKE